MRELRVELEELEARVRNAGAVQSREIEHFGVAAADAQNARCDAVYVGVFLLSAAQQLPTRWSAACIDTSVRSVP